MTEDITASPISTMIESVSVKNIMEGGSRNETKLPNSIINTSATATATADANEKGTVDSVVQEAAPSSIPSPPPPPAAAAAAKQTGVAGRINYAQWDKVTKELVTQIDEENQQEMIQEQKKLGLDGKYARSADEAMEREKAAKVKQTKRTLDSFKKRETSIIQNLNNLLLSSPHPNSSSSSSSSSSITGSPANKTVVRITRKDLDAGKRVVSITDVSGLSMDQSTIVLTSDLSSLESTMPTNTNAKTFQEDVENDVVEQELEQQNRSIYGVIKVFVSNLQNCTLIVKCKIITGTMEIHDCHNVTIRIEKEATVSTLQIDLSSNIDIQFHDAVSGKHIPGGSTKNALFWGEDKDDRIFHAGVSQMHVGIYRDGYIDTEITTDYMTDGAEQIGNSTPQEYQFVTSCIPSDVATNGSTSTSGLQLITENVVRAGNTTGTNVRAMTPREIAAEQEKRDKAAKYAIKMADDMIQIKDKDGNVLVSKKETTTTELDTKGNEMVSELTNDEDADVVEEVYTSMSATEIQSIVTECEQLKSRGNEAFGAGEYGQAILHYSLCLDKAAELPDQTSITNDNNNVDTDDGNDNNPSNKSLFPRDVIYSNRSAAFLKLGQHEKAESDADLAVQINPDNIKANFRKGLALHASGKYSEALPILAQAYKMEPNNKQIRQAIQFCEVRLEQEYRQRMSK